MKRDEAERKLAELREAQRPRAASPESLTLEREQEVKVAAAEECRRVTCRCSDRNYCGGWKTCSDRELALKEWCLPCLVRLLSKDQPDE